MLHAHTSKGSVGDSVLDIQSYIDKAKSLGLDHIAITDHGSMASMVEFHELCKKASITGIIGMEAYVVDDRHNKTAEERYNYAHLVLLAKNAEGVRNLLRIHNDAQTTGFYGRPRTDVSVLEKYGKNIIALSACVGGDIPKDILAKDTKRLKQHLRNYKRCFDAFYLEVQPGNFKEQLIVNDTIAVIAKKLNIPMVATNDIHYLNKEDWMMHDLHIKSCGNKHSYPDKCYYFMEPDEFLESFKFTKNFTREDAIVAINNTVFVAAQCDGEIDYNFAMPKYLDLPDGETEESFLTKICYQELKKRIWNVPNPSVYEERLEHELDVISELGFCGYFLIVKDFLDWARNHGIAVGPGRGSVGGSLVAWLLDIVVADPIKYGLLFERFLSANRKSLPDVDVDIASADREKVKQYVIDKYGKEHTALVGTFGIRKVKDSIRAAGRFLEMDLDIVNEVCKAVPFKTHDESGEEISNPTLTDMLADSAKLQEKQEKYPDLFSAAISMESFPKSVGIHAAGVIISPTNIMDRIPIRVDKTTGHYVSLIDKNYIEKLALKYDFLALASASVIDKTINDAHAKIDMRDDAFYEDRDTWAAISSPHTIGMFQISSNLYRQRMPRLRPTNIKELAACLALVRGPCIAAKTDQIYMDIEEGKRNIIKVDPRYDKITASTNGICIYQEQIMKLGVAFGLSIDDSYALMKGVAKKKANVIAALKPKLYDGAKKLNVPESVVDNIYKIMEDASKYSFNASHAVSYAIITYLTAYLKIHHPLEFMANLLTNAYESKKDDKKVEAIVSDCRRMGISFLPVDANKSDWSFSVEDGKIRIGFCAVKAFGDIAYEELAAIRPIKLFDDVIKVFTAKGTKLNKKCMTVAIFIGAFNFLGMTKKEMLYAMTYAKATKKQKESGVELEDKFTVCAKCELSLNTSEEDIEQLILKTNYLNFPGGGLEPVGFVDLDIGSTFVGQAHITKVNEITDRRGNKMAFVSLSASDGTFEGVIFSYLYAKVSSIVKKGKNIRFAAEKDKPSSCRISIVEKLEES